MYCSLPLEGADQAVHPPHAVVRRQVDPGLLRRGGHAAGEGPGEGESVSQSVLHCLPTIRQFNSL